MQNIFKQGDNIPVRAEVCDEDNIYQRWSCARGNENEWLVTLSAATRAGYLTTIADEKAFWSGKGSVEAVVTGVCYVS